jgi:hypothetical protein
MNVGGARSATLLSRELTNVDRRRSVTSLPLSSTVSGSSRLLSYFRLFFSSVLYMFLCWISLLSSVVCPGRSPRA